jgi:hypothetical protein
MWPEDSPAPLLQQPQQKGSEEESAAFVEEVWTWEDNSVKICLKIVVS